MQLREKQKLKRIYGVLERQFRQYFSKAEKKKGVTGENLLQILERRLDNVVYRLGFASSRKQARMLIRQEHFLVGGFKVNIASYLVEEGDVVEVKESSRQLLPIQTAQSALDARGVPSWLELHREQLKGVVKAYPTKEDIALPVNEQLVVELYSR
jgi:small subunit ribosomal protein S4